MADFDACYGAHYRRALALAVSLTGDRGVAEDLVQDAFTDAYRRWDMVGRYEDPAGWVRRAVVNRSASRWRRRGREGLALVRLAGRPDPAPPPIEPQHAEFWAAVRALPARQAQVVALHYVEDLSVEDIAHTLGIAEGSVKTHLYRARQALATRLCLVFEEDPR